MEIELRIPDDYCQGEASTLYPLYDDEFEEDLKVRKMRGSIKLTPRNGLTRSSKP
jgi:hypothetical protein